MKKSQLRQIIREEISKAMNEIGGEGVEAGMQFNYKGVTYKVTEPGATQSKVTPVTKNIKGKPATVVDNKIIMKQQ